MTHWLGDEFDGDRLELVGSDGTHLGGWAADRVSAGDSATATVSPGGAVRLVYDGQHGRTVIGTWQRSA